MVLLIIIIVFSLVSIYIYIRLTASCSMLFIGTNTSSFYFALVVAWITRLLGMLLMSRKIRNEERVLSVNGMFIVPAKR